MQKKPANIIALVILFIAAVCLLPWPCLSPQVLTATKLDARGQNLGTVEISMSGFRTRSLLLGEKWYYLEVGAFDGYFSEKIQMHQVRSSLAQDFKSYTIAVAQTSYEGDLKEAIRNDNLQSSFYGYTLCFSPDYDLWMIIIDDSEKKYYLGSLSGDHTTAEIAQYFSSLAPRYRSN